MRRLPWNVPEFLSSLKGLVTSEGREEVDDNEHPARPSLSKTDENIEKVNEIGASRSKGKSKILY